MELKTSEITIIITRTLPIPRTQLNYIKVDLIERLRTLILEKTEELDACKVEIIGTYNATTLVQAVNKLLNEYRGFTVEEFISTEERVLEKAQNKIDGNNASDEIIENTIILNLNTLLPLDKTEEYVDKIYSSIRKFTLLNDINELEIR